MKKLVSLLTLLLVAIASATAQNVSFKASAPNSVAVNERFRIVYVLQSDGGEQGTDFKMPDVQGLQQLFGPATGTQMNSYSSNGRMVTEISYTFTYTYLAPETGTYTVPPATIKVGNSTYKSNELTIKVVAADQAIPRGNSGQQQGSTSSSAATEVFVVAQTSKRDVYENEGFLISFRLYTQNPNMGINNMQYPNFEGFIAMEIDTPQQRQWDVTTYNNKQYYTILLKQWILYPIKAGKTTIEQGKFEVEIAQRVARERISFFDPIFDVQTVKKTLTSPAITIDAQPLPPGKPASFTGAVGDYSMTSSMTPELLKTDEVVTVKFNINGSGNIKYLKLPPFAFPNDFDELDAKTQESIKAISSGVSGSKSIEYYGIPRYAGSFTLPSVEFSYFDLKSKTYKTLSTPEYKLQVDQGEGGSGTQGVFSGTNKEDVRYIGQDIRHIKTGKASFHKGTYLWGSLLYWLCYIVPGLLFIVFFIVYRKQAAQNANIALMRTKKANKVATKRLKLAKKYLAENKREPYYEEISRAVWGYLGDKLNMPAADLTRDNVEAKLSSIGVGQELTSQFISILDTAEFARFAPSGGHEAMDELYNSTVSAINQMENRK